MLRRREPGDAHGWHTLDNYLQVHARRLDDFHDEGFLLEYDLSFRTLRADRLVLEGRIRCQGGLFIDVEAFLAVRVARGRRQVRTFRYTFHSGVEGAQDRGIFRYDNFHVYSLEGHPDAHQKHVFDHKTWVEIAPPEWIGEDGWPHLSDVIDELRQWWESTGQHRDLGPKDGDALSEGSSLAKTTRLTPLDAPGCRA